MATIGETKIREGTTRYVQITCKDDEGQNFDFTGFTVQSFAKFGSNTTYLNTTIVDNIVSYEIPASISVGQSYGCVETRIFKDGDDDVFDVYEVRVPVLPSIKPDLTYHGEEA